MIEINVIYGLILVILSLVLSGRFLLSKIESRDEVVLSQFYWKSPIIEEGFFLVLVRFLPFLLDFLGFKLIFKRRRLLKSLFPLFCPCHK